MNGGRCVDWGSSVKQVRCWEMESITYIVGVFDLKRRCAE